MQDQQLVNVLKGLVLDGVSKANSGHPGGPMSSMDFTYLLFTEYLKFDPDDPKWQGRDRLILSAGHMSMLLYSQLLGLGWLTMDDLKSFRQLHSKTPGHPENFMTPGVECTTGPLGQGCAMSVGFAIAARHFAAVLDPELFGYRTWVICSDGDLQEGVALGAASFGGHQKLGNLVWVYDKNLVQLSGPTNHAESDDHVGLFQSLGWRVLNIDGHDHEAIRKAYDTVTKGAPVEQPTLIIANTVIGKGAFSLENSSKTHGEPFSADERAKTKTKLGLPAQDFYFPPEALQHYQRHFGRRRDEAKSWRAKLASRLGDGAFKKAYDQRFGKQDFGKLTAVAFDEAKQIATRDAFGEILKQWSGEVPSLFGGSADLEPSNKTAAFAKAVGTFDAENRKGRNVNFGVREFPMSAAANGMALHGGLIPFDATFLSFADYSRAALRLGCIQKCRVLHVFTHDSFHLGEDGPTHQPVEQVMALRAIPELHVMRPADPIETEVLMRHALGMAQPSALCLTRQKVPYLKVPRSTVAQAVKGAYVVKDAQDPDLLIMATGSEVALALEAAAALTQFRTRVVSMPCWELFDAQPAAYRDDVLPPKLRRRVSIEAGTTLGWGKYTGLDGLTIGLDHYGASAPAEVLAVEYGFTGKAICERILGHRFT